MNEQQFYYQTLRGKLLGSKAREEIIDELIEGIEADSFFDFGCAEGYYVKKYSEKFKRVVGADIGEKKIETARETCPEGEFFLLKGEKKLPFKDNEFDLVLASEVLEHIPDWKSALAELKRVAGKNILITIPLEGSYSWRLFSKIWPMEKRGHLHKLASKDIEEEMLGWKLIEKRQFATPSKLLNKKIRPKREEFNIYSIMLFGK